MKQYLKNKTMYFLFWLLYKVTGAKTEKGLKQMVKYYTNGECDLEELIKEIRKKA